MSEFGKGLGSLIPGGAPTTSSHPPLISPSGPGGNSGFSPPFQRGDQGVVLGETMTVLQVNPGLIDPNPRQARGEFNAGKLQELTESIRDYGILEPLLVTEKPDGRYELIAGERRLRAAIALKLKTVPVLVRQADDLEKLQLSLIENLQRQDLNPIEEAEGYRELGHAFGLTQEEIARRVGKSRETISNGLRMLDLSSDFQRAIGSGQISSAHARILLGIDNPKAQRAVFNRMIGEKLTVREAQDIAGPQMRRKRTALKDPGVLADEARLREALNTKVQIEKRGQRGRILVQFYSDDDYQELIGKISGGAPAL